MLNGPVILERLTLGNPWKGGCKTKFGAVRILTLRILLNNQSMLGKPTMNPVLVGMLTLWREQKRGFGSRWGKKGNAVHSNPPRPSLLVTICARLHYTFTRKL